VERLGRHGERMKRLRRLARRRESGLVVVDGRRIVEDLHRWSVPLEELYLEETLALSPAGTRLAAAAHGAWVVADGALEGIAPTRHPQGVLAVVTEPEAVSWTAGRGPGVVLDRVQDPGNVGAVVRCAAALGARAVFLTPGCADPFAPAAVRGSAGAVFRLVPCTGVPAVEAAAAVREAGGEVWAAAPGGVPLEAWTPRDPSLLLLGSEGQGLDPALVEAADGTVTIPLERGVESLNVAVAAGILLQRYRQLHGT